MNTKPAREKLRRLHSAWDFFRLFLATVRSAPGMIQVRRGNRIAPSFREKIMLAVSGVNKCEYCSYLHTRTALESGLEQTEIRNILEGEFTSISNDEMPAILFAQHFADTGGKVSVDARSRIVDFYGRKKTRQIEGCIRAVYFGNLCSNTVVERERNPEAKGEDQVGTLVYLLSKPVASFIKRGGMKQVNPDR